MLNSCFRISSTNSGSIIKETCLLINGTSVLYFAQPFKIITYLISYTIAFFNSLQNQLHNVKITNFVIELLSCSTKNLMGYCPLVDFYPLPLTNQFPITYSQRHLASWNAIYILH